jgi:hypothetical protein
MDQETLRALGRANQRAQTRHDATRDALIDGIWEAADQGDIPQTVIVEATNFTRERIRQICDPEYRAAEMKRRAKR